MNRELQLAGQEWIAPARYRLAVPLLVCLALVLIKPVPFVGGGGDDFKYLTGAHCLGCLPTNHWEQRFLIVWPTGLSLKLPIPPFYAVMMWPVACALAAVAMLQALVEREWGWRAGLVAALALACTPIFANRSMRIGVDILELALLLGSILVIQRERSSALAGALLALAILSRPTQLAALPFIAAYVWHKKRSLKLFSLGFVAPILGEMAVYWVWAGDPVHSWKLSLGHAARPSTELSPMVDRSQSPLFNPAFIGGWDAPIDAHWTVRGLVNVLANPTSAPPIWGAAFVLLAGRKLDRRQAAVLIFAAGYFAALVYAFAIDPKPRMFMPVYAAMAAIIGSVQLVGLARLVPPLVVFCAGALTIAGLGRYRVDYSRQSQIAAEVLRREPREIDAITRERVSLYYWEARSTPGAKPLTVGRR